MARKKFTAILLAAVMVFAVCAFSGCGKTDDQFSEELDPNRTPIYVFNFDSGFGTDWLISLKQKFEAEYADYKGVDENGVENGKVGVQILMDNRKNYFSGSGSVIKSGIIDVYFTEYTYVHMLRNSGALLDITDWLTTDLTEFGENESIVDKMTAEQRAYYSKDGRYDSLPHYEAYEGIVYNIDLWKEKGFYFSHSERNNPDLYSKFTSDMGDLSAGPDGKRGVIDGVDYSADDGMPATYDDFLDLCTYIAANGCTPFIWTGKYYKGYVGGLLNALITDYEGANMRAFYELDGREVPTLIDSNGNKLADQTITEATAYKVANLEGRRKALELVEEIMHRTDWQAEGSSNMTVSHHNAQLRYLKSGYDGNKQIAMLLDGTWWEGEATHSFEEVAATYTLAKGKSERQFGWMSMPKADKSKVGEGQTYFDPTQGVTFVKSTLEENKKDIVKAFVRFAHSDKMLSDFTRVTSAAKALDYELMPEDEAQMTTFAKNLWKQREKAVDIIYPISNAPLFINNQGSFDRSSINGVQVGGKNYENATVAFFEIPTLTAQQAFEGMQTYMKNVWFDKLIKD